MSDQSSRALGVKAGVLASAIAVVTAAASLQPTEALASSSDASVKSRFVNIGGIEVFYREAGSPEKETVLLLHGFPSSSHMYRDLIPALAEHYHVLAPDYPGFGYTVTPPEGKFPYTFAALADLMNDFVASVGVEHYVLFVQDYGGPVGMRMAVANPDRLRGLVIQNAVANVEGWNPNAVALFSPFWNERTKETEQPVRELLTPQTTKFQYTYGTTRPEQLSPDSWTSDQAGLDRPGNDEIQLSYLQDYKTNVAAYREWGEFLKTRQPPTLIVWGKNDPYFTLNGVDYFRSLLPKAEVHFYDAGHFALETFGAEIATETLEFLKGLQAAN